MTDRLTVAVTGPTGEIGRAFLRALDRHRDVGRVLGMARRPFDPAELGLKKTEYRRGDVLDRDAVDALVAEADVLVHLAFIIFGGREETRSINLEGSRNVFAAAAAAPNLKRLVYTSSVAAYGFHADNPQPLTEDVRPRGSEGFYYSAQKAELERVLDEETAGRRSRSTCCARASSPGRTRRCSCARSRSRRARCRRCCPTRARRSSSSTTTTSPQRWSPRPAAPANLARTTSRAKGR